jgi:hypothetical protein
MGLMFVIRETSSKEHFFRAPENDCNKSLNY